MFMENVLRHFTSHGALKDVEFSGQFVRKEMRKQVTWVV